MKKSFALFLSLLCSTFAFAQEVADVQVESAPAAENKVTATLGVDLVNQYIWRGLHLGDVSIQPTLGIEYRGLSLSAWGSVGLSNKDDDKEIDLTLGYAIKGFSVSVTDYWLSKGNFFQFKNDKTTHVFGASVGYDFGFLAAAWYTNFAGADGVNSKGKRAYSSYFELSAPFTLGGLDWTGSIGIVPWDTDYYETTGFAVTDISLRATKEFTIKEKHRLPIFAGLTANPRAEKVYFIFGVSFYI